MPSKVTNSRFISYKILYDVFLNKKFLKDTIDKEFSNERISDIDKAFINRECTGVVENINDIDEIISKYSKIKINKIDKKIITILRLAIYEMLYMDKVPHFASINEAVELAKTNSSIKSGSFVNAVLRNVSRSETKNESDDIKYCYFRVYNDKETDVVDELTRKVITYQKYDGALKFKYSKVYYTDKFKNILTLDNFKSGNVLIEDASSIYLTDKLYDLFLKTYNGADIISTINVLDTCSAPGGKMFSLIDLLTEKFHNTYFESRDISEEKINLIKENCDRLKISNLVLKVKDATAHDSDDDTKFDIVMCDVPCTGLGVINKKPDIKLNYSEDKMNSLVKIQRDILDVSSRYLKDGGILSYSTCTTTKEENEDNICHFLDAHKNFTKIYEKRIGIYDENKSDGFYICFMKRLDG